MNHFKCKQQHLEVNPSSNGLPMGRKCEKTSSRIYTEKKSGILTETKLAPDYFKSYFKDASAFFISTICEHKALKA